VKAMSKSEKDKIMRQSAIAGQRQRGITMIEVLVTLVIMSVGLLGAAAMIIKGLESNRNAYLRTQSSILAYDMADRIRANPQGALNGNYESFDLDDLPSVPQCFSGGSPCGLGQIADADLASWGTAIQGESDGPIPLLPAAGATIDRNGDIFTITITWKQVAWNETDGEFNDDDEVDQQFVLTFNL